MPAVSSHRLVQNISKALGAHFYSPFSCHNFGKTMSNSILRSPDPEIRVFLHEWPKHTGAVKDNPRLQSKEEVSKFLGLLKGGVAE